MTDTLGRGKTIAVGTLSVLLAALYLFAGGSKLAGMQMHVEHFDHWGYPAWFRVFVGAWEVVFGLLLLIPRFAFYAAGFLSIGMIGAMYTELFRGDPPRAAFPAILFVLLLVVAYLRRASHVTIG